MFSEIGFFQCHFFNFVILLLFFSLPCTVISLRVFQQQKKQATCLSTNSWPSSSSFFVLHWKILLGFQSTTSPFPCSQSSWPLSRFAFSFSSLSLSQLLPLVCSDFFTFFLFFFLSFFKNLPVFRPFFSLRYQYILSHCWCCVHWPGLTPSVAPEGLSVWGSGDCRGPMCNKGIMG